MPSHTHLIVVPETDTGLRQASGEAHRRYTRQVNFRQGWREFFSEGIESVEAGEFERHERNGRPLGSASFVAAMGAKLGRTLRRQKPGPRRVNRDN